MPVELVTIPCRLDPKVFPVGDNYTFLVGDPATKEAIVVDVPEAAPINAELSARGWHLSHVLLTHHHDDHIEGLADLAMTPETKIVGAAADAHRLPKLDIAVDEGHTLDLLGCQTHILDVSGHTVGHIAYIMDAGPGYAFTGDSLMVMGCGRLFEGTPAQMWGSMQKFKTLKPAMLICSGHEYTQTNAAFAATLESDNAQLTSRVRAINAARAAGQPTVPSSLAEELATNPFLRADDPALATAIGMANADPAAVFAEIRGRKDKF